MQLVRPAALFLAATLFVAVAAVGCDRGSGTTTSPIPSVVSGTPAPSPTATPPPADPTLAAELRYRGDFEAAADVYAAVAADTEGDERLGALLAQAQMLLRAGDAASARIVLETQVREAAVDAEGSTAQFLLASTLDDLGEDAAALDLYSRYALAGGVLISYANIERAKLLAALGRSVEAESVASGVLVDPIVADLMGSFSMSMGRAYTATALNADALVWFTRAEAHDSMRSAALAATGAIKAREGDVTWVDDYIASITIAPGSGEAAGLLDALDKSTVPVSDYVRGIVEYRAARNDAARGSLERAAAAGDFPGEALYYLGALDERAEDDASAIVHYQQSYDADPASTLADSALWWRGRLLENAARYGEAIAVYALIESEFPFSEWMDGAGFHRGLSDYKAGRLVEAAETWGSLGGSEGSEGFRARLWEGKAFDEASDARGATVLLALRNDVEARGDYYALRAAELFSDDRERGKAELEPLTLDWQEIAKAIAPTVVLRPTGSPVATSTSTPVPIDLDADERWVRADELEAVGLHGLADSLRSEIIVDAALDERAALAVTQRFFEAGDESYAARAAATLLVTLPEDARPPDALLRIAYAPAYVDLVKDVAQTEGLDPLLLLALMRQESLYDPEAGSTAGALGLTQIIAPTGQSIADELGVVDFATIDLFRPSVNLRFGAHYLAAQLEAFDGNVAKALAAYNGGPGAAIDAEALAGDDPDLFVEDLEFEETRLYVRRVLEHYARYRALYGD